MGSPHRTAQSSPICSVCLFTSLIVGALPSSFSFAPLSIPACSGRPTARSCWYDHSFSFLPAWALDLASSDQSTGPAERLGERLRGVGAGRGRSSRSALFAGRQLRLGLVIGHKAFAASVAGAPLDPPIVELRGAR